MQINYKKHTSSWPEEVSLKNSPWTPTKVYSLLQEDSQVAAPRIVPNWRLNAVEGVQQIEISHGQTYVEYGIQETEIRHGKMYAESSSKARESWVTDEPEARKIWQRMYKTVD